MKIPILTYHSLDIGGNAYRDNDLVAFERDIRQIDAAGVRILPLADVVDYWSRSSSLLDEVPTVALTCDDGSDFDFYDLPHPSAGKQRSVFNLLGDFRQERPDAQPGLSVTSFPIISPDAREALDKTCLLGKGWWSDGWWKAAIESGLMAIGNHSWDHNHPTLDPGEFAGVDRGHFRAITTKELADFQIKRASDFLWDKAPNPSAGLFAYPYGKPNDYLVREYFPKYGEEARIRAAFADRPEPLHRGSNRWELPRYVFRRDWRCASDLQRILNEAKA